VAVDLSVLFSERLEDSISVNLSLVGITYADLIADAVRQLLWREEAARALVRQDPEAPSLLAALLARLPALPLSPAALLPAGLFGKPSRTIDLRSSARTPVPLPHERDLLARLLLRNPLAQLFRVDNLPGYEPAEERAESAEKPSEEDRLEGEEREEEEEEEVEAEPSVACVLPSEQKAQNACDRRRGAGTRCTWRSETYRTWRLWEHALSCAWTLATGNCWSACGRARGRSRPHRWCPPLSRARGTVSRGSSQLCSRSVPCCPPRTAHLIDYCFFFFFCYCC
jgi:hypothetical protein